MIYDVLKIAKNQLILYTPMKMSRWKGAIELPVQTFSIIVDFSREMKEMLAQTCNTRFESKK